MDTMQVDQPQEGVTRVTLDRPERLNAMNATLVAELHDVLGGIAVDPACRVVVLTGAGRGFCAGLDLAGYGAAPGAEGLDRVGATFATQADIAALVPRLRAVPQPVIAAVNGPAAGGAWLSPWRATSALPAPRPGSTSPSCASGSRAAISA